MRNAGGGTFTPTPSPYIVTVSDADFDSVVVRGDKPTLVDFWAPWCGPCQMVDPAMVAVADEFHEQHNIARINIDENQGTAQRYQVWGIPLLAIFHNGEIVAKHEGVPMDGSGDIEQATRDWVAREIAKIETVGPD